MESSMKPRIFMINFLGSEPKQCQIRCRETDTRCAVIWGWGNLNFGLTDEEDKLKSISINGLFEESIL